ncbi:MAG: site-specific integrase [Planctomycetota bacterium]|jgi:integrase
MACSKRRKKLLEYYPEWLRQIVVFALNTGLRQDELLSLEWSRVSFIRKTIFIQNTKSGRPRTIPLNSFALAVLNKKFEVKIRSINDLVFPTCNGTKILPSNLRRVFYKVLKKAEIKNFKFHDLRHIFASGECFAIDKNLLMGDYSWVKTLTF